jgi:hypothetical protein
MFFSLHRPLSVTSSFPKAITSETFAAIFAPRLHASHPADVIATLSNAVQHLDLSAAGFSTALKNQFSTADIEPRDDDTSSTLDSTANYSDGGAYGSPRGILSRRYQPFNPPPPPVPMTDKQSAAAVVSAAGEYSSAGSHTQRTYTSVLTIKELEDENGHLSYTAFSSPAVLAHSGYRAPTGSRNRMVSRRMRLNSEQARHFGVDDAMWTISVKRQRKLKMKKHKYKKLMKRTRTLRRRLERS